jgi:unsaturated rhamnogalacturonyl hydrolase
MIAYAILKGVKLGLLDPEKYLPIGRRVFEALVQHKLQTGDDGVTRLMDICLMAGMGNAEHPRADGSVAYYLSEPKNPDDAKGVGPFMMALSQYMTCQ